MELSNQEWNFPKLLLGNGTLEPNVELSKLLGGNDKKWNFQTKNGTFENYQ